MTWLILIWPAYAVLALWIALRGGKPVLRALATLFDQRFKAAQTQFGAAG